MPKNRTTQVIPYNTSLLDTLSAQHKNLMLKYKEIISHAQTKQYAKLQSVLNEFSILVSEHFSTERELYMYLELVVSNSDGTYLATRTEMKDIAVSTQSLINLYKNIPATDATVDKFITDFGQLGKDLLGRMRFEETHLFNDYKTHKT